MQYIYGLNWQITVFHFFKYNFFAVLKKLSILGLLSQTFSVKNQTNLVYYKLTTNYKLIFVTLQYLARNYFSTVKVALI